VYSNLNTIPDAFSIEHYTQEEHYKILLEGYDELKISKNRHPKAKLAWLWKKLLLAREQGFGKACHNGLSEIDNKTLATTTDTLHAVHLIWKGLDHMIHVK